MIDIHFNSCTGLLHIIQISSALLLQFNTYHIQDYYNQQQNHIQDYYKCIIFAM